MKNMAHANKLLLMAVLIVSGTLVAGVQSTQAYISMTYTGLMVTVESGDDESGYFSWTLTRGPDPFLWGMDPGGVMLPAYGVQSVTDPADWTSVIIDDTICWSYTGPGVWIIDAVPVTFGYQSSITTSRTYGQGGNVNGAVYDLGYNPVGPVGWEKFACFAPIPEPGTIALFVVGFATMGLAAIRSGER
jgi:hypothetical protein